MKALEGLCASTDKNLLVGLDTSDDAGVYQISHDCALVETVDIITPLVDDPYTFGRIAATNALSDVYAMGARPLTAMNLAFFPSCSLPGKILKEILKGGQSVLSEAGVCLVGGHTVDDKELKYGLSVTGTVNPNAIVRNSTACIGDVLLLTKPLGTGIISTAIKGEVATGELIDEAIGWMTASNRNAAELMTECHVHAATDITGFGLAGHAMEMAKGSGTTFRLNLNDIPLMTGITHLINEGMVPAGCYRNREHLQDAVSCFQNGGDALLPLFDPQTSGGLLISLSEKNANHFISTASSKGIFCRQIGDVTVRTAHALELRV